MIYKLGSNFILIYFVSAVNFILFFTNVEEVSSEIK